jgi:hypothetical protein
MVVRLSLILALLIFAGSNLRSDAPGLLIDNFDGSRGLQRWSFSNGAEFPGASGTLSLGPGHQGRGAVLAFEFACLDRTHCGHYVAAIWKAPSPVDVTRGAALSMWVSLPPDVRPTVRVIDETGQTLEFFANTPTLEHSEPDEWQRIIVPITGRVAGHWGGANTGQIHGRIVKIAILADSRYPQPAQGQMAFDDIWLSRTADVSFRLDRTRLGTGAGAGSARLGLRLGVNIHSLKDERGLDLASEAGFKFVRVDLLWAELEKQDRYDFTPFDNLMRSLEARDMGVLWLLAYGHPEHGGRSPQSTDDLAAYGRYAAAAVSHFRGHNVRFEVWNEPNGKQFLENPATYPDLLRAALDAIRLQDPNAAVSTGGTSGFDFPFLNLMLESDSAKKANAIGVHPYRDSGPETLAADLLLLRGLIQRTAGLSTPVWDTEWGYSSYGLSRRDSGDGDGHSDVAQTRQAVLVARECLTVWILGLPLAVVYDLRDDGSDPFKREQNFGLLNQDNSEASDEGGTRVDEGRMESYIFRAHSRRALWRACHAARCCGRYCVRGVE